MNLAVLVAVGLVAAVDGAGTMSFLAIGDWGGSDDAEPTAAGEVDNNKGMGAVAASHGDTRFVMAVGDNFYENGIQGDETSSRFHTTFEDVFTAPGLQVPWYAVAGNHDWRGNVSAQIAYSALSKRWVFPSLYYTFQETFQANGANVTTQIVYIDTVLLAGHSYKDANTGEFVKGKGPDDKAAALTQLQWLEQQLNASKADYLWVSGHYPIYSQCSHGPTAELIRDVLPLLSKYKAQGYIAGHDHCMGHFEANGLAHVLTGSGKECCYDPKHITSVPPGSVKFHMDSSQTYGADGGFASFAVTTSATTIAYHDATGKVLYTSSPVLPRSL